MSLLKNKLFITLAVITALLLGLFAIMPKPIATNLEAIGQGQKAVVFIYDPNLVGSNQQATAINKARSTGADDVLFLAARTGDPAGEAFKRRYQADSLDLLFFDGQGRLIHRDEALLSHEELLATLSRL
jgi:hypothetical protein